MDKGTVVLVPCEFQRGSFSNERLFIIHVRGGQFRSLADVGYCYRKDFTPLGDQPAEGEKISGYLTGLVIRVLEDGTVRVHLPDGEVYKLDQTNLVRAKEVATKHVPV